MKLAPGALIHVFSLWIHFGCKDIRGQREMMRRANVWIAATFGGQTKASRIGMYVNAREGLFGVR